MALSLRLPDSPAYDNLYADALRVIHALHGRRVGEPYLLGCGLRLVRIDNFPYSDSAVLGQAYGTEYVEQLMPATFTPELRRQRNEAIRRERAKQRAEAFGRKKAGGSDR
jgi:hypothetical protein